jgi:DNA-binding XRE family transcriptional regulator
MLTPRRRNMSLLPLSRKFRKLRSISGLTQLEASRSARISNSTLCLFESGFIALKPKQLAKLKLALKRTIRRNMLAPETQELMAELR